MFHATSGFGIGKIIQKIDPFFFLIVEIIISEGFRAYTYRYHGCRIDHECLSLEQNDISSIEIRIRGLEEWSVLARRSINVRFKTECCILKV